MWYRVWTVWYVCIPCGRDRPWEIAEPWRGQLLSGSTDHSVAFHCRNPSSSSYPGDIDKEKMRWRTRKSRTRRDVWFNARNQQPITYFHLWRRMNRIPNAKWFEMEKGWRELKNEKGGVGVGLKEMRWTGLLSWQVSLSALMPRWILQQLGHNRKE